MSDGGRGFISHPVRSHRRAVSGGALFALGPAPLLTLLTGAIILMALLLGGGTLPGLWSDAFVQLAGLVLIGVLAPAIIEGQIAAPRAVTLLAAAAIVLLPLYQLLPLPPSMWTHLPHRDVFAATYREAGIGLPWLPVSLDPAATQRSLLALLPALAVFLATQRLGLRARRSLSLVFVAAGMVSVLLGLAQVMQGPASPLRLFPFTHLDNSVGFFANRNHYAALLYCLIPIVAAWIAGFLAHRRSHRVLGVVIFGLAYVALLLGLGMAASRTGIVLAVAGAFASLFLTVGNGDGGMRRNLAIMAVPIALGAVAVLEFAFFDLAGRFGGDVLGDYRFRIAATTVEAAKAFQPTGSGFGTFVPIYQMFEKSADLIAPYVNHAHDDWLELWLEGGWPALLILLALLGWFAHAAFAAWRTHATETGAASTIDRALPRAGSIAIVLLAAHSFVDYPLRTTALMVMLAFCAGLLGPPLRTKPA